MDPKDLPKYGLDAELALKEAAKFNPADEALVIDWIEECTGEKMSGNFMDWLNDGKVLVKLINAIGPASVKANDSTAPFKKMENIANFLKACREVLNMRENDLFTTADLYDGKSRFNVVNGLIAVSRAATKKGFKGPSIAPKEGGAGDVKHWDVGKVTGEITKLSMGSAGTMAPAEVDRSRNVTFGAEKAGTSTSAGGITKLAMGSAGVMPPSEPTVRAGITFGDKAGRGEFTKPT
jgi:hypothetical protein